VRTQPLQATEPIVAYRWFQVGAGGVLSGAQDVEWPSEVPMRAHHIGALEDAGGVLRALTILVGIGAAACAAGLVAGAGLLITMVATGGGSVLTRVGAAMLVLGAGWGLAITLVMEAMAPLSVPREGHRCPAPAARFAGRWTPACGIYAYNDVARAVAGTQGAWVSACPVVVAKVLLWGDVYVHRWGYRAEHARIEALYDDGRGHVELPAARYGVPVEPYPVTLRSPPAAWGWGGSRRLGRFGSGG
jgi:hypothetical protein